MHHLQMAVVERDGAGDVAQFAFGQELFQIILARVEIGDGQRVGVVACLDIVGRARPVRRRRAMPLDGDGDGRPPCRARLRRASAGCAGRRSRSAGETTDRRCAAVSPSRAEKAGEQGFSSFGPMPGSAVSDAKSGLSTGGRIELSAVVIPRRRMMPARIVTAGRAPDPGVWRAADICRVALYIRLARPRPGFWRLHDGIAHHD